MKRISRTLILTLAALLIPAAARSADDVYRKMANDFAKYSANKKVKNLAVIGFSRKARTSREESDYVSEKLLSCLVASGKVNLLERSQLDKVLEERRLAAAGVTEEAADGSPAKINPSDAIIVGTIFGTRDQLKIIAKMIDPLTGAVLHTVEAQTERQWEILPERPEFAFEVPDLRDIAAMFGDEDLKPAFVDFRDAPAGLDGESCRARRARLASLERETLEAKAKYWALQMRDPSFSARGLQRNPGGEIKDEQDRKRFYKLLGDLHAYPGDIRISTEEINSVMKVMAEEKSISDDCGLH